MYAVLIIGLALLVILFISIAKVYRSIPIIELKRRARAGQEPAKTLYKVASYQSSLQFVLLLFATISSAFFFVLVALKSPVWVALTANVALIWVAYIWIPRSSINIISQYFAQILARPLAWLLQYFHPSISALHKKRKHITHTGLYEKSDIVRLLKKQHEQEDNRIEKFELDLLEHVIGFGYQKVIDIMTPSRKVHSVPEDEVLGPIVMSELHKTGHTYFPVYEGKDTNNIVGVLGIVGLSLPRQSLVAGDAMSQPVLYVHEEQYLGEVLQLIIKSSQELFLVINSEGEYTGIITAREVLKSLVGTSVSEEFDKYDQRDEVAKRFDNQKEKENEINTPDVTTEVIE